MPRARKSSSPTPDAQAYRYPDADMPARPEIGGIVPRGNEWLVVKTLKD